MNLKKRIASCCCAAAIGVAWAPPASAADPPPEVIAAERSRIALVEAVAPTVVCIFGQDGGGGGSGVLISPDGFALTNFHVTSGSGDFMKCGLNDGKLYDAVIVGIDPTGDVALIKLLGRDDFPAATLGDSDALQVGDWVYVIGNPFLLAADFTPTVTYGMVSGLHRYQYPAGTFLEYTDCIQFDTSLNPGNSGGPLFNERGEVVGINGRGSFEKRGRVNVGAGYAISINQIKHFLDHLRSGRVVDHGSIGATVSTGNDGAVRIASILDESDAYRRGLRSGDEIVTFAGRPIRSANQFQNVLGIYPDGWRVPLTYRRGTETTEIVVQMSGAHRESELLEFSKSAPAGDNPEPGRPKEGDKPEAPESTPTGDADSDAVSKELRELVVKKAGFANYYFNVREQRRVLQRLSSHTSLQDRSSGIILVGRSEDAAAFELTLSSKLVGFELGGDDGDVFLQPLESVSEFVDEPPGTGGFLAGMHLLAYVLRSQTEGFASFYYHGSEPLDGVGKTVDVLIVKDRGSIARVYVSSETGHLEGLDFRQTDASDDCQIRCHGPQVESEIGRLPRRWEVRFGGNKVLALEIEAIRALRTSDLKP